MFMIRLFCQDEEGVMAATISFSFDAAQDQSQDVMTESSNRRYTSKVDICTKHIILRSDYMLIGWFSHQEVERTVVELLQRQPWAKPVDIFKDTCGYLHLEEVGPSPPVIAAAKTGILNQPLCFPNPKQVVYVPLIQPEHEHNITLRCKNLHCQDLFWWFGFLIRFLQLARTIQQNNTHNPKFSIPSVVTCMFRNRFTDFNDIF